MFELNLSQMNAIAGGKGAPGGFNPDEMDYSIMRSMSAMSAESDDYDGDYEDDNSDEDSTPTDEDGGSGSNDNGTPDVVIIGHSMTDAEKEEYDRQQRELEEARRRIQELTLEAIRLELQIAREKAEAKAIKDAEEEKKRIYEETKKACEEAMKTGGERAVRALPIDNKIAEWVAFQAGRAEAALNDPSCIKFKQLNEEKNQG